MRDVARDGRELAIVVAPDGVCLIRDPSVTCAPFPNSIDLHGVEHDGEVEDDRQVLDVVEVVAQLLHRVLDASSRSGTSPAPSR